jgi:hypothetical protein
VGFAQKLFGLGHFHSSTVGPLACH